MMENTRIASYRKKVECGRYPIAAEKWRLTEQSMYESEGEATVVRRAKAFANVLDHISIFIEPEDLFVGAGASIPGGFELQPSGGVWSPDDIDSLIESGGVVSDEVRAVIDENARRGKSQDLYDNMYNALDCNDEMQGFVCSGIMLPPWKVTPYEKGKIVDAGGAGAGLGMIPKRHLAIMDFETVLARGMDDMIRECRETRAALDLTDGASYEKSLNLKAMLICLEAFERYAARYAVLAEKMAAQEKDEKRRAELLRIAETCRRVPAQPPRNFPEALQFYWFLFVVNNDGGVTGMGRFDQILYPYYRASIDAGEMTDEDVLEYLQMLRLADMRINGISVTAHQPGGALCGATPDGRFAHEILADGCVSPTGGRDHNGPLAVFSSAMKLPQDRFNAMLLNMKFHPTALKAEGDRRRLMAAIRVYLKTCRHVQFNVVDRQTLLDAQREPEKHEDLMVRIAGYSTYFVALNEGMQNEIIKRTENKAV